MKGTTATRQAPTTPPPPLPPLLLPSLSSLTRSRGRGSSFARPLFSSSASPVLARAGFIVAKVVGHLHRVHQRGAAAVYFYFWGEGETGFFLSRYSFFSLFSISRFQINSKISYLHLAIASVLRTYLPELRIPRRWSEDCGKKVVVEMSVEVEKKKKKKTESRRSKLVFRAPLLLLLSSPSLSVFSLSLTFFLGTAIHRRCCCQSELWKGEAEAKSSAEEEERVEERVEDSLRRPPMISAGSAANVAPIGPSVASPPVLVEEGQSPLDVQGTNRDW